MGVVKDVFVLALGLLGLVYILNPGAGFLELIPDNIPFIGNLDEGAAVVFILAALRYYNVDVSNIFSKIDDLKAKVKK